MTQTHKPDIRVYEITDGARKLLKDNLSPRVSDIFADWLRTELEKLITEVREEARRDYGTDYEKYNGLEPKDL